MNNLQVATAAALHKFLLSVLISKLNQFVHSRSVSGGGQLDSS
jgi:hypothetical protein